MTDSLNWATVYPELLLLGMACVIALFDLVVKTPLRGSTYRLTLLTLGVVAALEAMNGQQVAGFPIAFRPQAGKPRFVELSMLTGDGKVRV